jgi:multidrug efflux pump subunit AcrA (membrane-fusion protein)
VVILSQRLGSPVTKGDALFEIARLDRYRIMIDVSEYDLSLVDIGQKGELVLTSLSDVAISFVVTGISSVSDPAEGENRFRVEADVVSVPDNARPGMEGIAKINAGEAKLIWAWMRGTINRLRIFFWRFMP